MARVETGTHAKYFAPGLRSVYTNTLDRLPREARQLFKFLKPRPSDRSGLNYIDDILLSGLGAFAPKAQGSPIQYDVPNLSDTIRTTPYTWGLGFRATMEANADDIYGVLKRMSERLALSANYAHESEAFRLLTGGFATTNAKGYRSTGFDGLELFSASHTLLKSNATRANRMATDEDLSVMGWEHIQNLGEQWVDHQGFPMPIKFDTIVCGPVNKWIAKELCESELHPYTGNNARNPLGGEGLKYMVIHWLPANSKAWFAFSSKNMLDTFVWMRQEPAFEGPEYDFDTGDFKYKGIFRQAEAHNEPDGVAGSQGA